MISFMKYFFSTVLYSTLLDFLKCVNSSLTYVYVGLFSNIVEYCTDLY